MTTPVVFSVSTWQQPVPEPAGPARQGVLERVADLVEERGAGRLRVAIDGLTAAGKTSFGHELGGCLAGRGRPVFRASLDDFKRPWAEADQYDRTSGPGYYRNAFDYEAVHRLLLDPAAPEGDGRVALCSIDPITQLDHSAEVVTVPADGVLVVDGVFAFRPEIDQCWDLRVWIEVAPDVSIRRGTDRDGDERLHRDRYLPAELLYLDEVGPVDRADVVVDNTDVARPGWVRPLP